MQNFPLWKLKCIISNCCISICGNSHKQSTISSDGFCWSIFWIISYTSSTFPFKHASFLWIDRIWWKFGVSLSRLFLFVWFIVSTILRFGCRLHMHVYYNNHFDQCMSWVRNSGNVPIPPFFCLTYEIIYVKWDLSRIFREMNWSKILNRLHFCWATVKDFISQNKNSWRKFSLWIFQFMERDFSS